MDIPPEKQAQLLYWINMWFGTLQKPQRVSTCTNLQSCYYHYVEFEDHNQKCFVLNPFSGVLMSFYHNPNSLRSWNYEESLVW
jgi:hypothetical protein